MSTRPMREGPYFLLDSQTNPKYRQNTHHLQPNTTKANPLDEMSILEKHYAELSNNIMRKEIFSFQFGLQLTKFLR